VGPTTDRAVSPSRAAGMGMVFAIRSAGGAGSCGEGHPGGAGRGLPSSGRGPAGKWLRPEVLAACSLHRY
jgi:hypothetical protein